MEMLSTQWSGRLRVTVLFAAVLLAFCGFATAQDQAKEVGERLKKCPTASDVAELRWCVEALEMSRRVKDLLANHKEDQMADCAMLGSVDAIRTCLLKLASKEKSPIEADSAAPTQSKPADPPQPPKREWVVREQKSRMDDTAQVVLALEADEPVRSRFGAYILPTLIVRCHENTTSVYVVSEWYLDRGVQVMHRFDGDKAATQTWESSTTRKAAGLWSGASAIPFIKTMLDRKTLLMRVWPYDEGPQEMAFSIVGLAKVIEPLRKACKW